MEFRNEYTKFNALYYDLLKGIYNRTKEEPFGHCAEFINHCESEGIDLQTALYKKVIDEAEEVMIDSKKVTLLPMGYINENIPRAFVDNDYRGSNHYGLNFFRNIFEKEPTFQMFYYPNNSKKPLRENFEQVRKSYTEHYAVHLNESWSEEDFYARITQLDYLSVKYAKDEETGEIFAVGFFGALVKSGAGGKTLTDAELYVMPQFRNLGIAKKLVYLSFELAHMNGISNFDSVTYRVGQHEPLRFWKSIGASVSGLIHIEGNIPEMIENLNQNTKIKK